MAIEHDDEDVKFDQLLADRRHKELIASLNSIALLLSTSRDTGTSASIEKQTQSIQRMMDAIQKLPAPQVNVNQDTVVSSVSRMAAEILAGLAEVKKCIEARPAWEFTVTRNHNGFIDKITAKQK